MRQVLLYVFFHLILHLVLNSQSVSVDSLRNRISELKTGDEKIKAQFELSKLLSKDDLPSAHIEATKALYLARQLKDTVNEVHALLLSCEWLRKQYNYLALFNTGKEALQLALKTKNNSLIIDSYIHLADGFAAEGKHVESITYLMHALEFQELIKNDPVSLANLLCKLGRNLRNTGEFDRAFSVCERALKLCQEARNPTGEAFALSTLSLIYAKKGDNQKALTFEEDALKIAQLNGDQYREVVSLHNICDWNLRLGNLSKALELTRKIEPLNHVLDDPNADIELYKLRGRIFFSMKDAEQALVNFQKALAISKKVKNPYYQLGVWEDMIPALIIFKKTNQAGNDLKILEQELINNQDSIHLPKVWLALGRLEIANSNVKNAIPHFSKTAQWYQSKQMIIESAEALQELSSIYLKNNQIDEALQTAMQSLSFSQQSHSKSSIAKALFTLKEIYLKKSDYLNALTYFEQYSLFKDSLISQDLQQRLAEERIRQNIGDIEQENNRTQQANKLLGTQNKLYIALGVSLLTLLFVGIYFYQKLHNTKNQLNDKNQELVKLSQTKDKFFGIIAHDLRGPLASFQGIGAQLSDYLAKGDTQKIANITGLLTKSATNLRSLLDNLLSWALMNRGEIPYLPEMVILNTRVRENIMLYEQTLENKGIQIINKVADDLRVWADSNAIDTILRNLIGNAVKFTSINALNTIQISSEIKEDMVRLAIFNSGIGIAPEKLSQVFNFKKQTERGSQGEKGIGLGLILCKELAEMNQGWIELKSDENVGVYAIVFIPHYKITSQAL